MKIRITHICTLTGITPVRLSELLWPNGTKHSREVLLNNWINKPVTSIRLEQLKVLCDLCNTTNINNLIDFEDASI